MNYHGMVAKARWLEGRQGDNASIEFNIQQGSLQTNQQSNQRKQLSKKQQRLATAARCGHRSTSCWLVGSPDICRNKSRNPSESSYVLAVYGSKIEIDVGHVWFLTSIATICLTFLPKVSYSIWITNLRHSVAHLVTNQTCL